MANQPAPGADQSGHITFVRLTEVPLPDVLGLLNDRRIQRHLPLAGEFSEEGAAEWVRAKDDQWRQHGYGPWAVLIDARFAGWGGFQREGAGADFALVLHRQHWGRGADIMREAMARGFGDLELHEVTVALPYSRRPGRLLSRLGFRPDGEVSYSGVSFARYRVTAEEWQAGPG